MVDEAVGTGWQAELEHWLAPFLVRLGHKARQRMCPLYVAGLTGPGERKGIQPMAERLGLGAHDRLHHFIAAGTWDAAPLLEELARKADEVLGGDDAVLVVDDTALPKKGNASVGVAPQHASALGKQANCQTLVSLTLARGEVPVMVGLRLFLPDSWTGDPERMRRSGVPAEFLAPRSKPEIAIQEIDRLRAAGLRFGAVLADAGYGLSAPFRQALSARGLHWAVGIPRHQKVYPADVALIFLVTDLGLLDQCRGGSVRHPDHAPPEARRLPLRDRAEPSHPGLPRRPQRRPEALPPDRTRRHHHRQAPAREASAGITPLESFPLALAHGNVPSPLFVRASSPDQVIPPDRDLL